MIMRSYLTIWEEQNQPVSPEQNGISLIQLRFATSTHVSLGITNSGFTPARAIFLSTKARIEFDFGFLGAVAQMLPINAKEAFQFAFGPLLVARVRHGP